MANVGFESNPFLWTADGWLSHAELTFAWSWLAKGERCHELVHARADKAHAKEIPRPASLLIDDEAIWAGLVRAALEVPLCKYLGVTQGDRYEPDPAKWHSKPKTKQRVWYEFLHVTCGAGKYPYRVSVIVNNVIHHGYAVPHQLLARDAPTNINFSLEYMQAFAEYKYPSTVYEGISFEGDRPEILLQVPDGGLDIQDVPVH